MPKFVQGFLVALFVLVAFAAGVQASDGIESIEASLRADIEMDLNGETVTLHDPPILYEGRTYLPVRSLATLLGANITWYQHKKWISIETTNSSNAEENSSEGSVPDAPAHNDGTITGVIMKPDELDDRPTESQQPDTTPQQPDTADDSETFRFHSLMQYEMQLSGESYQVLANVTTNKTVYVRVSDIQKMPFDLTQVHVLMEEETGQLFVRFSEIRTQFSEDELVVNVLEAPVVNGVPTDHLDELLEHGQAAHSIRPISGRGEYELLYSTIEGMLYIWHVEVNKVGNRAYINYLEKTDLYEPI